MLNKAILMGRLTRDPEIRYTQNNTPVVPFTIAVERNYSGQGEKQTDFIDIVAWRKTAEFISNWFTKGQMIVVVGSIQSRRWKDKTGANRTSIEVVADEVQFGESKKSKESSEPTNNYTPQYPTMPTGELNIQNTGFEELDDDGELPF